MNIVTPIPMSFSLPTNPVGTDAVRRDNFLREAIPSVTQGEKSAAEKGVGKEGERGNQAASQASIFQNPTYDRPTINQAFTNHLNSDASKDNANQESAGKENAEAKLEQQQEENEKKTIVELKNRDQEVRIHEQAHAAVGGQYASAPKYEYQTGPDNKRYAVGGEVSIDVSTEKTPRETIQKMQQVKAAALAPAEPSAQDFKVANAATQKEQAARSELVKEQALESSSTVQSERQSVKNAPNLTDSGRLASSVVSRFYSQINAQAESSFRSFA